jgi:hypothetical protein
MKTNFSAVGRHAKVDFFQTVLGNKYKTHNYIHKFDYLDGFKHKILTDYFNLVKTKFLFINLKRVALPVCCSFFKSTHNLYIQGEAY